MEIVRVVVNFDEWISTILARTATNTEFKCEVKCKKIEEYQINHLLEELFQQWAAKKDGSWLDAWLILFFNSMFFFVF